jgi:CBS domain containing-hemolysin-like protein
VKRQFDGADGIRATSLKFVRKTWRDEKREKKRKRWARGKLASRPRVMVAAAQCATASSSAKISTVLLLAKSPTLFFFFFSYFSSMVFFLVNGFLLVRKK